MAAQQRTFAAGPQSDGFHPRIVASSRPSGVEGHGQDAVGTASEAAVDGGQASGRVAVTDWASTPCEMMPTVVI